MLPGGLRELRSLATYVCSRRMIRCPCAISVVGQTWRGHLAAQHEPHFHIAVWTDNENEWEVARFISSPPYRDRTLAESDAHGSDLLERVGSFNVDVVACDRACPRSGLGVFGYEDEDH